MKRVHLISITSLLLIAICFVVLKLNTKKPDKPKEKPNEWFYMQRAFPYDRINHDAYLNALSQAKQMRAEAKSNRASGLWEFAGPVNIGGRITDVEMHHSDLNTIYLGAASGGIFQRKQRVQLELNVNRWQGPGESRG